MAFELRQEIKLSQQLVMTMQLQQAIKLLQLSHLELVELLQEEMKENPVLIDAAQEEENVISSSAIASKEKEAEKTKESDKYIESPDENVKKFEEFLSNYNSQYISYGEAEEKEQFESVIVKKTSLVDYLTWQLRLSDITEEEMQVGSIIINSLNDGGYLTTSVEELAETYNYPKEKTLGVLLKIQELDPPGIAARNLKECLLKQVESLEIKSPLVTKIIKEHIKNLETRNYKAIAKSFRVSIEEVYDACKIILSLEPRPGRIYSTEDVHYITPDIYVYRIGDKFVISLNEDGLPKLKVSPYYKNILTKGSNSESSKVTKEYIINKLRSAEWIIKSIHQRQKTIYKVTESILKFQRDFFEHGVGHLNPLVLRNVAEDIGRHESTVSRVTSNKYVYTPHGLFKLGYFFTNAIETGSGDERVSTENIKERIKELIAKEDSKNPLSDQEVTEILKKENVSIARRTVAKYRENLKILPSKMRKRVF
jgi:RNA polymerase sigma-54 factor